MAVLRRHYCYRAYQPHRHLPEHRHRCTPIGRNPRTRSADRAGAECDTDAQTCLRHRSGLLLQGNDYYSAAGPLTIQWAAASYYSLAQLRPATGQEMRAGRETGFEVNPGLVGPVFRLADTQPGFSDGGGFQLRPDSAMVGSGLDLWRLFRIQRGPVNFSGHPLAGTTPN